MESYQSIAIVLGIIGIFLGLLSSIAIGSYAVVVVLVSIVGIVVPLVNTKHHQGVGITLIVLGILGNLLLIIPGIMACRYKPKSESDIKLQTGSIHAAPASSPPSNLESDSKDPGKDSSVIKDNRAESSSIKNGDMDGNQLNLIPIATENIMNTPDDEQENNEDIEEEDDDEEHT